jgi:hypothetical protein
MPPESSLTPDGLTPATAVPVERVSEEYAWLREHYPSGVLLQQRLELHPQGPRDVLVIGVDRTAISVYFDVSSFYGRRKDRPTAPCPYCGQPLRTARAKQCRHCKKQWHDRAVQEKADG